MHRQSYDRFLSILTMVMAVVVLASCSSVKFIPEGSYLLDRVSVSADTKEVSAKEMKNYVTQLPNTRWLSCLKAPMGVYMMGGVKGQGRMSKMLRRVGEAPVVYDSLAARHTQDNLKSLLVNHGFLKAEVELGEQASGHRMRTSYRITAGPRWHVRNVYTDILDTTLIPILEASESKSLLVSGMPYDANILNRERARITGILQGEGYYRFNNDFIHFVVDSTVGDHQVDVLLQVHRYQTATDRQEREHTRYRIGDITFSYDSVVSNRVRIRDKVIQGSITMESGEYYDDNDIHATYARMMRLGAVAATNINLQPSPQDSSVLDTRITLIPNKLNSIKLNLDGTNSAGDFGAAAQLTYQNRNLFHGSEVFSIKLRGAFEAIRQLAGYDDQNYIEYNIETGIAFPDFKFPFLSRSFRRNINATSELSFMFGSQDRPEFHRRVLQGSWRYKWMARDSRFQHRLDLLDLNYVFMPWISDTFRQKYLDDPLSRNAILRYMYQDLFIMKWGYQFVYTTLRDATSIGLYGKDGYTLRVAAETAGNLLHGISAMAGQKRNANGCYELFDVAYAQYAKFDFDFARSFSLSPRHSLALRFALGVAYPYGNATILPYEKRYFSGGANSVRGWNVRQLGPGSFQGSDGNIDFINQTGDVKVDINLEYRAHLFWKVDGALFLDAGNIWTLREYEDQPGGQFTWDKCWEQIALAYGLGVRMNFDYFLLRLDMGMKAINPAYQDWRHYPIAHPDFSRDYSIHFAVGLPF